MVIHVSVTAELFHGVAVVANTQRQFFMFSSYISNVLQEEKHLMHLFV